MGLRIILTTFHSATFRLSLLRFIHFLSDDRVQILQPRFHHPVVAGLVLHPVRHPPRRQLQDNQGLPEAKQGDKQEQQSEEEEEKGQLRLELNF